MRGGIASLFAVIPIARDLSMDPRPKYRAKLICEPTKLFSKAPSTYECTKTYKSSGLYFRADKGFVLPKGFEHVRPFPCFIVSPSADIGPNSERVSPTCHLCNQTISYPYQKIATRRLRDVKPDNTRPNIPRYTKPDNAGPGVSRYMETYNVRSYTALHHDG